MSKKCSYRTYNNNKIINNLIHVIEVIIFYVSTNVCVCMNCKTLSEGDLTRSGNPNVLIRKIVLAWKGILHTNHTHTIAAGIITYCHNYVHLINRCINWKVHTQDICLVKTVINRRNMNVVRNDTIVLRNTVLNST